MTGALGGGQLVGSVANIRLGQVRPHRRQELVRRCGGPVQLLAAQRRGLRKEVQRAVRVVLWAFGPPAGPIACSGWRSKNPSRYRKTIRLLDFVSLRLQLFSASCPLLLWLPDDLADPIDTRRICVGLGAAVERTSKTIHTLITLPRFVVTVAPL